MRQHLYDKRPKGNLRGLIVTMAALFAAMLVFVWAVGVAGAQSDAEQEAQLREAIRRAMVTCYATEGQYPPSLDYLTKNYALAFDGDRFIVSYDAFASNIMPTVSVLRRDDGA